MIRLKITFIAIIILLFSESASYAQISEGGLPYSHSNSLLKSSINVPGFVSRQLDIKMLLLEDKLTKTPNRYSIFEDVLIDIKEKGVEIDLPDEDGKIWLFSIESENAKSIQLYFNNFLLPPGASLYVYNQDYSIVYGAFTSSNNNERNQLMLADLSNNHVTIEYYEPYDKEFEGLIELGSIGQAYKELKSKKSSIDFEGYINVNSPEGEEWQNDKHAVCLFTFKVGNTGYLCSGALLNNYRFDGTPYFLTADHCISDETAAGSVVTYFNFERQSGDGELRSGSTLSGSDLLTHSSETDFSLLLLDNTPPASYQPFYSAWNATEDQNTYTVGIHHPEGKPKKISIDNSTPISYANQISWQGNTVTQAHSHWKVIFDEGKTSTGSSGSPLISAEHHQIIGQLHGGSDEVDYYGKLSKSFNLNSPNSMSAYLDPDNLQWTELEEGYYPTGNLPDPQIYPEFKEVCKGEAVKMTGMSAFTPTSWVWSFSPNTISYVNETNSYYREPIVQFEENGTYDVTLTITNVAGRISRTFPQIVSVGSDLSVDIEPYASKDSCLCSFDSLVLMASGAQDYLWQLSELTEANFYIINDTVNPAVIKMSSPPITSVEIQADISLTLTGSHGTCSEEVRYTLPLINQENDSIKNATRLFPGKSALFSNKCAGIEENEPIPLITSCTGQFSWCDEYGTGEDIIENSVWFYFIPDEDGKYEIESLGMDNQIALYKTNSVEDLLGGSYQLIGANDDYTATDFNPKIRVDLTSDKSYLLQVDGSAGGATGNFYFNITMMPVIATNVQSVDNQINIYPQPVTNLLIIEYEAFVNAETIVADIYNISGSKIFTYTVEGPSNNKVEIDFSEWNKGVYFIRLKVNNRLFTEKVIKY